MIKTSVIICTYNRALKLGRLLQALARQNKPTNEFEVIVVVDGSTDQTLTVCREQGSLLANFRVLCQHTNMGQASSLNKALAQAKGDNIVLTDDDCIPLPNWLQEMSLALEKNLLVAGSIALPDGPYFQSCHNIAEFHHFLVGRIGPATPFIAGANMGFQRSLVEKLGSFDESDKFSLAPDMAFVLLARSRGIEVFFAEKSVVQHDPDRNSFSEVVSYSAAHAKQTVVLRQLYAFELNTPLVLRHPFLLLFNSPVIALKVTLEIFLRNPSLWKKFHTAPMVYLSKLAWCCGGISGLRGLNSSKG